MRIWSLEGYFVYFFGARDPSGIIFQKLGWFPKSPRTFLPDLQNNRDEELFLNRKVRGLGPQVIDSGQVAWSTVDRWQSGQKAAGARRRDHWRGRKRERGGRRTHLGPHRGSGGGVVVGRRWRSGGGGETWWWRCLRSEGGGKWEGGGAVNGSGGHLLL
jgi:hypothetical protein